MKIFRLTIIGIFLLLAISCQLKTHDESPAGRLDAADRYIEAGSTADAVRALKSVSDDKIAGMYRIGVYRRLIRLGEFKLAEKCLKTGLRENPENAELNGLYVWFLMEQGRLDEAAEKSSVLEGTAFASLHSEAQLKKRGAGGGTRSAEFVPFYMDAYAGSGDGRWLRNAALIAVLEGDKEQAATLYPDSFENADDALFWAFCSYDGGNLVSALEAADWVVRHGKEKQAGGLLDPDTAAALLLESDIYQLLDEDSAAEEVRSSLIFADKNTAPTVLLNSARYALRNGDWPSASVLLNTLTEKWPDYAPGLALYGDFALSQLYASAGGDRLELALRDAGLSSLRMELTDVQSRIPVEDAAARIASSARKSLNGALLVKERQLIRRQDMFRKSQGAAVLGSRESIWEFLERNTDTNGVCPPELIRCALEELIESGNYADAESCFTRYLKQKYGGSESYTGLLDRMSSWECEYAAYFLFSAGNIQDALQVYEYLISDMHEARPYLVNEAVYEPEPQIIMNMAALYSGSGRKPLALETYRKAAALTEDAFLKAECLYRMACIQSAAGDKANAAAGLEYCLSLDPSHNKARMLLSGLKSQK